jgi:uncharacterized protein YdeI (YjbR/CyaY-like superfamily)
MAAQLVEVDVRTREEWRRWLAKHHGSSAGVWLVRHKQHTGVRSMTYEELVCETHCFGWVDSLIRRLDDDRYALKVTPRKATSKWSESNRKRWQDLEKVGRLAPAGRRAAPTSKRYAARPTVPELPNYIATAIRTNANAWQFFRRLARADRRDFVVWIYLAKRPETRERRIRESIRLLAAGKKLGPK